MKEPHGKGLANHSTPNLGTPNLDTMKEPGAPRKVRLGAVRNPQVYSFQETPGCYISVSTSTSGS